MKVYKKRGITFSGVIVIYFTLIVLHPLLQGHSILEHMEVNTLIMLTIYFIIGLATERIEGIPEMIERIWTINKGKDVEINKFELIKSFLEVNVSKWEEYWNLYQEIVNGKKPTSRVKFILLRIPKGSISVIQFIWIVIYVFWNSMRRTLIPTLFTDDIVFIIDLIGLGFFILTSGNVIGLRKFLTNIFECFTSEKEVVQALRMMEALIIYGAKQYGFLRGKLSLVSEKFKAIEDLDNEIQDLREKLGLTNKNNKKRFWIK